MKNLKGHNGAFSPDRDGTLNGTVNIGRLNADLDTSINQQHLTASAKPDYSYDRADQNNHIPVYQKGGDSE